MKSLRERLFSASALKETEAEFFGQPVIVRELTAKERYAMGDGMGKGGGMLSLGKASVAALIGCVLDPETHKPVFELADLDTLMGMSGGELDKLLGVMNKLSGLAQGAAAEAEKNSQKASVDSSSSSPSPSTAQ